MAKEVFEHSQLFAGEVGHIVRVPVTNATIKRGDVLECPVDADSVTGVFSKATNGVNPAHIYVVAAEDKTDYTGEVVAYADGYFDAAQVRIDNQPIDSVDRIALMASKIYIVTTN